MDSRELLIVLATIISCYLKTVISSIGMMNKMLKRRRHFNWFLLTIYVKIMFQQNWIDDGPFFTFFKDKSFWMKIRNQTQWIYALRHWDDKEWIDNFRVSKGSFMYICDRLRDYLKPADTLPNLRPREPVSVEKKVAMTLYFLSSCGEYRQTANFFGLHKSTVCKSVREVIYLINKILLPEFVKMPDERECIEIEEFWRRKVGIRQLILAIDGSHIPILPPSEGFRDFVNRKGWPSLVLQAAVDHKYK